MIEEDVIAIFGIRARKKFYLKGGLGINRKMMVVQQKGKAVIINKVK